MNRVGIKQATAKGYIECDVGGVADFSYPESQLRRGRVQRGGQTSPTITAQNGGVCRVEEEVKDQEVTYRIRKLTERECLRLMDVEEQDIDKILAVQSKTQAYKQAGNSIVVSCLCAIFSQLNIQGIKPWNERTYEEKMELVARRAINNGI